MQKQATGRYSLLQAALWGIYGILFTYANRYLLDTGLSNTATGVIIGAATALSFGLQPALTAVVDRTRLQVRAVLLISGQYEDSVTGSFCYTFFLRPWGDPWPDTGRRPACYESWYLPKIQSGASVPDKIDAKQKQSRNII